MKKEEWFGIEYETGSLGWAVFGPKFNTVSELFQWMYDHHPKFHTGKVRVSRNFINETGDEDYEIM